MKKILMTGLMGALAAVIRLKIINIPQPMYFPYITFSINILASGFAGFLAGRLQNKGVKFSTLLFCLLMGFAHSLSTFSGFMREIHVMNIHAHLIFSLLYMTVSVIAGIGVSWYFYGRGKKI